MSEILPTGMNNDDVYRPTLDSIAIDIEEDSGDNKKDLDATSIFNSTSNQGTPSQKSGDKRKQISENKDKVSDTKMLANVVSVMAETCCSHKDVMREMIAGVPDLVLMKSWLTFSIQSRLEVTQNQNFTHVVIS